VNAKQKAAATAKKGKSKPLVSSESVEDQKEKQRHLQIMLHQKLSSLNQEVAARAAKALKNKVANAAKAEAAKAKAAAKAAKAKAAQEKGGKAAGLRR